MRLKATPPRVGLLLGCAVALAACVQVLGLEDPIVRPKTDAGESAGPDGSPPGVDSGAVPDAQCRVPPGQACTTFPLCGCSGGENCVYADDGGAPTCLPAGSKQLHEKCALQADCVAGYTCVKIREGSAAGLCLPYCNEPSDCPKRANSWSCSGSSFLDQKFCLAKCDLRDREAVCGPAGVCYFDAPNAPDGTNHDTFCIAAGARGEGTNCDQVDNECGDGLFCYGGTCRAWCVSSDDCGGRACIHFTSAALVDGLEYGYCGP
jgi:hypothetical protein